jgi:hypothetical protein
MINLGRLRFLALPTTLLLASLSQAAPVVVNGSFETGNLSGWTVADGAPVVTSSEAHTGTYSVAAFSNDAIRQNFGPVATADITEFSFWVKRAGGPFDFLQLFYGDASNENLFPSGPSSDWTYFNLTASLDVGKTLTGFLIYGTDGPAYLDDFVVNTGAGTVPEPSNLALSALALLCLYGSRRKA